MPVPDEEEWFIAPRLRRRRLWWVFVLVAVLLFAGIALAEGW